MSNSESSQTILGNTTLEFSRAERDELTNKVRHLITSEHLDGLILFDSSNLAYASGIFLPYPEQYHQPKAAAFIGKTPVQSDFFLCPAEWRQVVIDQDWQAKVITTSTTDGTPVQSLIKALAKALSAAGLKTAHLGLDMDNLPAGLVAGLKAELPEVRWTDMDEKVRSARLVKTVAEIRMLEEAARQADRAIVAALNHSEGCVHDSWSYSMWEFTERVRVHVGEFGGSGSGHLSTLQGAEMGIYSKAPVGNIKPGNPMRTEVTSHHRGYWTDTARTLFVGQPDQAFLSSYQQNIALKQIAVNGLRAGVTAKSIFDHVVKEAHKSGIVLWEEAGIGHGIGVSEREAPYLNASDETTLQSGMIIVLALYTYGPNRELICSKDMYSIQDNGCRLLSWYRDWNRLYSLYGNTARHG